MKVDDNFFNNHLKKPQLHSRSRSTICVPQVAPQLILPLVTSLQSLKKPHTCYLLISLAVELSIPFRICPLLFNLIVFY